MSVVRTFQVAVCLTALATLMMVSVAAAEVGLQGVPHANAKVSGFAPPNVLSPELDEAIVAQGSMPLENGTADFMFYGYNGDGPMLPAPGDIQASLSCSMPIRLMRIFCPRMSVICIPMARSFRQSGSLSMIRTRMV